MARWTQLVGCLWLVACFDPDGAEPDASDTDAGGFDADAAARDGGRPGDGGLDGGRDAGRGPNRDGGALPLDGQVPGDGGGAELCRLPADTGPCDAAIPRWAWNAELGACELFSWGGCDGNANNFQAPSACLAACAAPASGATACKVGNAVFPDGAGGIEDPFSCNTCTCSDGTLACTEIACSEACPPNSKPSTSCAECGPVDNCEVVEHGCFLVCDDQDACTNDAVGICADGACRNLCG